MHISIEAVKFSLSSFRIGVYFRVICAYTAGSLSPNLIYVELFWETESVSKISSELFIDNSSSTIPSGTMKIWDSYCFL